MLTKCYSVKMDESRRKTEERYSLGDGMKLFYSTQHNRRSLLLRFLSCLGACQQPGRDGMSGKWVVQGRSTGDMGCLGSLSPFLPLAAWG